MSEEFSIEDVKRKFDEITDTLDSIKTQNAINIGDTGRVLNNIGVKLDNILNQENISEAKEILLNLKKDLEDRGSYLNVRFTEWETSFKDALSKNDDLITVPQMKELFDVLSTNLTVFSKQIMSQGDILNEITLRIEALRSDDTDKREIIKNINSIKGELDKFNNGFESIILNINNNFENINALISRLDPTTEVKNMTNTVSGIKSTTDTIISAVQVVDQKQNTMSDSLNEIISQNTNINANIKALAGQSDFDGLVKKIENAVELITVLKSALTDSSEQSQKSLLVQLDKLSSVVSKILTEEDFQLFKTDLSNLVNDVIESSNVLRGDLLNTNSDLKELNKVISSLDVRSAIENLRFMLEDSDRNLKDALDESKKSSMEQVNNLDSSLKGLIEEKSNDIKDKVYETVASIDIGSLRNEHEHLKVVIENRTNDIKSKIVETISNVGIEEIKSSLVTLSENLDKAKKSINEDSNKNSFQILEKIENTFNIINDTNDIITNLPETMRQVYVPFESDKKILIEDVLKTLSSITNEIHVVQNSLNNISSPIKDALADDINQLKNTTDAIVGIIATDGELFEKLNNLDLKLINNAGKLDASLKEVTGRILDYMSGIKENCESADIKMNNFAFEFNSMKSELDKIVSDFNNFVKGATTSFNSVSNGISLRFDAVSEMISSITSQPAAIAILKENMDNLQQDMKNLIVIAAEMKANSAAQNDIKKSLGVDNEFLDKIGNRINKVKDQLNFISTDIMENLYNRADFIVNEIEPIKKAVMSFVGIDFQNIAVALKEQMDAYKIGMEQFMQGIDAADSRAILNNLFTGLGTLENKFSDFETSVNEALINKFEDVKNLLNSMRKSAPIQIEEQSLEIVKLEEILNNKVEILKSNFNTISDNVVNQLVPHFDAIDKKQNDILSKLNTPVSYNIDDKSLDYIKNQLNELFEKVNTVQDEILHSNLNTNTIDVSSIKNLDENEKNVLEQFTGNLQNIASLVKKLNENIDCKISDSINSGVQKTDFEALKADIASMLSSIQGNLNLPAYDVNKSSNVTSQDIETLNAGGLLEKYKIDIFNKIESVKNEITSAEWSMDLANNIKVLNQKMDLLTLSDDFKLDIDRALDEIRATVQDQKKFLDTVNILETLSTLEDISKLKGIEQLEQLSNIISVDKLNALNKLTLLDKLKNLDCLDELEKIPKISGILEVQDKIKNTIVELDKRIDTISKNYANFNLVEEDFKNELNVVKTAIMKHVINVFEQLSFVVEGEEIKDFVDEKSQNAILETKQFIENTISDSENSIKFSISEIKELLKDRQDIEDLKQLQCDLKSQNETIENSIESLNPLEYKDLEEDLLRLQNISIQLDSFQQRFEKEFSKNIAEEISQKLEETKDEYLKNIGEELKQNIQPELASKLNEVKEHVSEQFSEVNEQINEVNEKFNGVNEQFNSVKEQFNILRVGSTEDVGDYTYAMQDIETDIAHLRLAMDDVINCVKSNSLKQIADYVNEIVMQVDSMKFNISQDDIFKIKVDVEKITGDILSISSRMNKLLLASDESAQALNASLVSFRDTISELYTGLKKLDYSTMIEKLSIIEEKIANNEQKEHNTLNAINKITEWTNVFEEKTDEISETINKLKKSMPSNEAILDDLEVKFAKQQQRMDMLEEKLDELLSKDKDSSNISKKFTDIDKQLTKLNNNIEKLTSYVDEE